MPESPYSQAQLAQALGLPLDVHDEPLTGEGWPGEGQTAAYQIGAIREKFKEFFQSDDELRKWLQTPCKFFGGEKPWHILSRGQFERFLRLFYFVDSGMPT